MSDHVSTPGRRHISAVCENALFTRLLRQAAKETDARGKRVTPSAIIRWALEDYLAYWETAPLISDPPSTARGIVPSLTRATKGHD